MTERASGSERRHDEVAGQLGLGELEVVRINDRYATFSTVDENGQKVFLKIAEDPGLHEALEREAWWHNTVNWLREERDVSLPMRAPRVLRTMAGALALEFVEGEALIEVDRPNGLAVSAQQFKQVSPVMLSFIVAIDNVEVPAEQRFEKDSDNSAPYDRLWSRMETWGDELIKAGALRYEEVESAIGLARKYQPFIEPSLQHGDFVPWHVIKSTAGDRVLIDGEKSSLKKPRFYDLAYLYTRIVSRGKSIHAANELLVDFMEHSREPQSEFWPQFLPVLTLRAIAINRDAMHDLDFMDYRAEAHDLLSRCLLDDPQAILRSY